MTHIKHYFDLRINFGVVTSVIAVIAADTMTLLQAKQALVKAERRQSQITLLLRPTAAVSDGPSLAENLQLLDIDERNRQKLTEIVNRQLDLWAQQDQAIAELFAQSNRQSVDSQTVLPIIQKLSTESEKTRSYFRKLWMVTGSF